MTEAFYADFDRSYFSFQLQRIAQRASPSPEVIGEGTHSVVYRLTRGSQVYAMSVAKDHLREGENIVYKNHWLSLFQGLRGEGVPLVPPGEVVAAGAVRALVCPLGSLDLSEVALHWQPLEAAAEAFSQALARIHLELDDVLQIRHWEGVPFICDFSDLRRVGQR